MRYNRSMVKSWKHKGLKTFFDSGSTAGIKPQHAKRLKMLLQLLDVATTPKMLNLPGFRFHQLTGKKKGFYSVKVNGNWRLIFAFDKNDAIDVDYLDYH